MLDDAPLNQKAAVARSWFNKVRMGRMKFTAGSAETFEQLLEAIVVQANLLEAENNILKASRSLAEAEAAVEAVPQALLIAASGNVVRFPRGGTR